MENQLTIAINFISSKDDNDQEHGMYSKSDNTEISDDAVMMQRKL